jgi:hypothetical protein
MVVPLPFPIKVAKAEVQTKEEEEERPLPAGTIPSRCVRTREIPSTAILREVTPFWRSSSSKTPLYPHLK